MHYPIILALQGIPSILILIYTELYFLFYPFRLIFAWWTSTKLHLSHLFTRKFSLGYDLTYGVKIFAYSLLTDLVEEKKRKTGKRDKLYFKKDALIHGLFHTYNMWLFVFRILYYHITNPFIKDQQALLDQNALEELYRDIEIVENRERNIPDTDRNVDHSQVHVHFEEPLHPNFNDIS
ncbi:hypothetical protein HDV06_001200 [Boothiomyces sp. JEL0866]|nr:hypothetical protein HDV06_001200 [Boothiomyces sp. JEL0866]